MFNLEVMTARAAYCEPEAEGGYAHIARPEADRANLRHSPPAALDAIVDRKELLAEVERLRGELAGHSAALASKTAAHVSGTVDICKRLHVALEQLRQLADGPTLRHEGIQLALQIVAEAIVGPKAASSEWGTSL